MPLDHVTAASPEPVRAWPGMRSEYAWVGPHLTDGATTTGPHQVGVSFNAHHRLVYRAEGRVRIGDVAPGTTIVSGEAAITWLRVHEHTEALEIYPDAGLVADTAAAFASRPVTVDPVVGGRDATVLGIGTLLRRAHVAGAVIDDVAAGMLAHRLAMHLVTRYGGVRIPPRSVPGLLPASAVDAVADVVEARLGERLTLDDLAAVASLSPFHFARAFARTTGLPPHRFVTSRRMDRARRLLEGTGRPVETVARDVGFSNVSHFRRAFRDHHGVPPAAVRAR